MLKSPGGHLRFVIAQLHGADGILGKAHSQEPGEVAIVGVLLAGHRSYRRVRHVVGLLDADVRHLEDGAFSVYTSAAVVFVDEVGGLRQKAILRRANNHDAVILVRHILLIKALNAGEDATGKHFAIGRKGRAGEGGATGFAGHGTGTTGGQSGNAHGLLVILTGQGSVHFPVVVATDEAVGGVHVYTRLQAKRS